MNQIKRRIKLTNDGLNVLYIIRRMFAISEQLNHVDYDDYSYPQLFYSLYQKILFYFYFMPFFTFSFY